MKLLKFKIIGFLTHHFRIDAHYFISGGFWLSLTQVIVLIGGLISSVVFANILSETDFGIYRYLIGIGVLLTSFSLTGMSQSIFQTASKNYQGFLSCGIRISHIYSIGITLSSIIGAIYYAYNDNATLALGCLLIGILQPLINTYQLTISSLQGSKKFAESTYFQLIKTLFITILGICSVIITHNVLLLLTVFLVSNALTNYIGYIYYKPKTQGTIPEEIKTKYLHYAKHTSIRNIITNVAHRLDTVLVFQQLGAVELALYTIANLIPEQIKGSLKNLAALLIPKYVQHNTIKTIKKGMLKRSLQLLFILLMITIIYILFAPFVYDLLFPKYEKAVFLSQLAALSFPAFVLLIPNSALQAHLEEKKLYHINLFGGVAQIILVALFIPVYGLIGAIVARILSRYINLFLSYYYIWRK